MHITSVLAFDRSSLFCSRRVQSKSSPYRIMICMFVFVWFLLWHSRIMFYRNLSYNPLFDPDVSSLKLDYSITIFERQKYFLKICYTSPAVSFYIIHLWLDNVFHTAQNYAEVQVLSEQTYKVVDSPSQWFNNLLTGYSDLDLKKLMEHLCPKIKSFY